MRKDNNDTEKMVRSYEVSKNVIGLDGHWYRIKHVNVDFKYNSESEFNAADRMTNQALALKEALEKAGILRVVEDMCPDFLLLPGFYSCGYKLLALEEIKLPPQMVLIPMKDDEGTMKMQS